MEKFSRTVVGAHLLITSLLLSLLYLAVAMLFSIHKGKPKNVKFLFSKCLSIKFYDFARQKLKSFMRKTFSMLIHNWKCLWLYGIWELLLHFSPWKRVFFTASHCDRETFSVNWKNAFCAVDEILIHWSSSSACWFSLLNLTKVVLHVTASELEL